VLLFYAHIKALVTNIPAGRGVGVMQNHCDHFAFRFPSKSWGSCPSSGPHTSFSLLTNWCILWEVKTENNAIWIRIQLSLWFLIMIAFSPQTCRVIIELAILHRGLVRKNIAILFQCCGSGIFIPIPDPYFYSFPDPGSIRSRIGSAWTN
jgi:hypothetical protein